MITLTDCIIFATNKHAGQVRKVTGLPYITHPLGVLKILEEVLQTSYIPNKDKLLKAAVLHDVLEDTETSLAELTDFVGFEVADIVNTLTFSEAKHSMLLTHNKGYLCELQLLFLSQEALLVKLADKLHNVSDNPSEKQVRETDMAVTHLVAHRALNKPCLELCERITNVVTTYFCL